MTRLFDALQAGTGIVCAVGAGGKKSTLYRLLSEHPGRAAFTASVYTTYFPDSLNALGIVEPDDRLHDAVLAAHAHTHVAYAQPGDKSARLCAVPIPMIERLHREAGLDATYVKADGARMRWIKSPRHDEPMIPPAASTVLVLASARALGESLSERIAQRVELIESVTGLKRGETIFPEHLARLMTSEQGLLKGTRGFRVIPVINMVDDGQRRELAAAAAEQALRMTDRFSRVVLSCMRREGDPIVEIIE